MTKQKTKLTNPFIAIVQSFYSLRLYRETVTHWHKRFWLYTLIFLAVFWLPFVARFMFNLDHMENKLSTGIAQQLPTITFKSGIASVKDKKSQAIYFPGTHLMLAMIDVSGRQYKQKQKSSLLVVGKKGIMVTDSQGGTQFISYPADFNLLLTPQKFLAIINGFKTKAALLLGGALYVSGLMLVYLLYLIFCLLFSQALVSVAQGMGRLLLFVPSLNLAVVVATPIFALFSLFYAFDYLSYGAAIVLLMVLFFYTIFGIYGCYKVLEKKKKE